MAINDNPRQETHHLLPSGTWEGFYNYSFELHKHLKQLIIRFFDGKMDGSGSDDLGHFSWSGVYDLHSLKCSAIKIYASHRVIYEGHIDENGIWGLWQIDSYNKGGFHIWPKTNAQEEEQSVKEPSTLEVAHPKISSVP